MKRRINLYGGPGVGKSTLAARLFAHLKTKGASVELVQEFAKQAVYLDRRILKWDCVYVAARQLEAELRPLKASVDRIITDSPLLLQWIYARRHGCTVHKQLFNIAMKFEQEFPSVNFIVRRSVDFQPNGRWENHLEAQEIDRIIEDELSRNQIDWHWIDPTTSETSLYLLEL